MRRLLGPIAVAGLLLAQPKSGAAQTNIDYFAQFGPATTVVYLPFYVSTGGAFNLGTKDDDVSALAHLDPHIRLFSGASSTGPGLGTQLGVNDDGAVPQPSYYSCSGAGNTCHSLISMFLSPGSYTLTLSVFDFLEAEARAGYATFGADQARADYCNVGGDWSTCNYDAYITSEAGVASLTPEPASFVLLGTGVVGLGGIVRRRRRNREG